MIFMISCLRAAGAETQGGDEEDGSRAEPRLPPDATDPEAGCGEFAAAAGELTYEFVTHCQSYQSSPFHCRVDSPPCRCAHGTRRHAQSRVVLRRSPTAPTTTPTPPDPAAPSFSAGSIPVGCPPASTGRHIAASHVKLLRLLALFLSYQPF